MAEEREVPPERNPFGAGAGAGTGVGAFISTIAEERRMTPEHNPFDAGAGAGASISPTGDERRVSTERNPFGACAGASISPMAEERKVTTEFNLSGAGAGAFISPMAEQRGVPSLCNPFGVGAFTSHKTEQRGVPSVCNPFGVGTFSSPMAQERGKPSENNSTPMGFALEAIQKNLREIKEQLQAEHEYNEERFDSLEHSIKQLEIMMGPSPAAANAPMPSTTYASTRRVQPESCRILCIRGKRIVTVGGQDRLEVRVRWRNSPEEPTWEDYATLKARYPDIPEAIQIRAEAELV